MVNPVRVGVVRGGPSREYDVSLQSGAVVMDALRNNFDGRYRVQEIFIDKKGNWHIDGAPVSPLKALNKVDVVFNALHGEYGEDGKIQTFLESHHILYTGSDSFSSAIGMNKVMTKRVLESHGVVTPKARVIETVSIANNMSSIMSDFFNGLILPVVVKPATCGSSIGVSLVKTYRDMVPALELAAKHSDKILVEEYIRGVEATCGVIEGFRGEGLYALPSIEIRPGSSFFDFEAKYSGKAKEIVPANFSMKTKRLLEEAARTVHRVLGLRHYSRTDFIIHPKKGIYVLEVNTLPGLSKESLVPKALRAVGSDVHELAHHVIGLALGGV